MRAQTGARLHKDYLREGNQAGERIHRYQAEGKKKERGGQAVGCHALCLHPEGTEKQPLQSTPLHLFDLKLTFLGYPGAPP